MFTSLRNWLAPQSQASTKPARTMLGCDSMEDRTVPSANPLGASVGHTLVATDAVSNGPAVAVWNGAGPANDLGTLTPQVAAAAPTNTGTMGYGSQGGQSVTTPFSISGDCLAKDGMPLGTNQSIGYTSTGTATQLGRYTGYGVFTMGSLIINPETGEVTGTFSGTFTFVAANGDKLVTHYGIDSPATFRGQMILDANGYPVVINLVFDATFVVNPTESTGRFAGATGSFHQVATAPWVPLLSNEWTAPFTFSWVGDGELTTQKGKK